jgi:hypothetical protein
VSCWVVIPPNVFGPSKWNSVKQSWKMMDGDNAYPSLILCIGNANKNTSYSIYLQITLISLFVTWNSITADVKPRKRICKPWRFLIQWNSQFDLHSLQVVKLDWKEHFKNLISFYEVMAYSWLDSVMTICVYLIQFKVAFWCIIP